MKDIYTFSQIDKEDVSLVGGKAANLGEMYQAKVSVPKGFIIAASAYFNFLTKNKLEQEINAIIANTDVEQADQLESNARRIQKKILEVALSQDLAEQIRKYYKQLGNGFVAVRSSGTSEDLPQASFAGQQATFLNVKGDGQLLQAVRKCWASLFEPRAIFYRQQQHFDQGRIGIAVVVQKMVAAESSGVMFTVDPVTNDRSKIIIEAVKGLGEMIVSGAVNPDHYQVDKQTLSIVKKETVFQERKLVFKNGRNEAVKLSDKEGAEQKISDDQIMALAKIGYALEKHYFFPQDIEWAIEKGQIAIVQTRPVTTLSNQQAPPADQQQIVGSVLAFKPIVEGQGASTGIAVGVVRIIKSPKELGRVKTGDVLVTEMTSPDFVPAMKKAVAVVTDRGGRSSHAAIVSRELGIAAVVGTNNATQILQEGMVITVDGRNGKVYKGGVMKMVKAVVSPARSTKTSEQIKTATKVYVNLAEPEKAQQVAQMNVDGVGLLRAEFMLSGIGVHPKKVIKDRKEKPFISTLSGALATFCQAFHPRPVVYRATDFKTNEYRSLPGGESFEPKEENPMLGYRGAFRYINDPSVFQLELEAIKEVRNKHGLKNLWLMIPFVRTPQELARVKQLVQTAGFSQTATFKLWMMVEIPANVIQLEQFIAVGIDGISIGSNDLTQLMLGIDRDNNVLSSQFDERNPAVMWAMEETIKKCHQYKITSSVCGQAPSIYPEITQKLVEWGVTSISVSPDSIDQTRQTIYDQERRLVKK